MRRFTAARTSGFLSCHLRQLGGTAGTERQAAVRVRLASADDVAGIMQRHGYKDVTITEDYSGVPRIVYGTNARPDVDLTRDA